jgi:hypothetical protein
MRTTYFKCLLSLSALLIVVVVHLGLLDAIGLAYTEAGFKRALITFGIVRGLNGVISVAQGTEVAVEPVGVGMTFTPGEILDPVNDLIERFSWVVLASGTSLGIQRVFLDLVSWVWFSALVTLSIVAAIAVGWWPKLVHSQVRGGLLKLAVVLVIVRFSVPAIAIASEALYTQFLEPQYTESQRELERTVAMIKSINQEAKQQRPGGEDESLLTSVKKVYESATGALDVEKHIEAFKHAAADISEFAIQLIVVFVTQTILFPLFFLWVVIQLVRKAVTANLRF